MDMTDVFKGIIETGLRNNGEVEGDFTDADGILHCGRCREPKRMWLKNDFFPEPMLVSISCKCQRDEETRRKAEEQARRDMEQIRRLRLNSLMDDKFRESTFDTFVEKKENARNLRLCRRYAEGFAEMLTKNQGLLFYGNVGTGKTFAAACIANYLLDQKVPTVMTSFVKIINTANLRSREDSDQFIARLNRAKLLIIDDLGAERSTDYALERVYDIIDSRYRARLPMILTTNLSLSEMKDCADIRYTRIYDRIFEVCYPMEFTGKSWRRAEASRRFDEMERFLEGS